MYNFWLERPKVFFLDNLDAYAMKSCRDGEFTIVPVEIIVGNAKTRRKPKKTPTKSSIVVLPRCSKLIAAEEKRLLRGIVNHMSSERYPVAYNYFLVGWKCKKKEWCQKTWPYWQKRILHLERWRSYPQRLQEPEFRQLQRRIQKQSGYYELHRSYSYAPSVFGGELEQQAHRSYVGYRRSALHRFLYSLWASGQEARYDP